MPLSSSVLAKLEAIAPTSRNELESWSWSHLQAHGEIVLKGYQRASRSKVKHERLLADLAAFYEVDDETVAPDTPDSLVCAAFDSPDTVASTPAPDVDLVSQLEQERAKTASFQHLLGSVIDLNDEIAARVDRVERRVADHLATHASQSFADRERAERHGDTIARHDLAISKLAARIGVNREHIERHCADIPALVERMDAQDREMDDMNETLIATLDDVTQRIEDQDRRIDGQTALVVAVDDAYAAQDTAQRHDLKRRDTALDTLAVQVSAMRQQLIQHDHYINAHIARLPSAPLSPDRPATPRAEALAAVVVSEGSHAELLA